MSTRAWDLKPGDVLTPVGLTVLEVEVDEYTGQGGRQVHVHHDLGVLDLPINETVRLANTRESGVWE